MRPSEFTPTSLVVAVQWDLCSNSLIFCVCVLDVCPPSLFYVSSHREIGRPVVCPVCRCLSWCVFCAVPSGDVLPDVSCDVSSHPPILYKRSVPAAMATVAMAGAATQLVPYLAAASSLPGFTHPTLTSPQSTTPGYPVGSAHNYVYQKQREGRCITSFTMMSLTMMSLFCPAAVHQKQREGEPLPPVFIAVM